MYKKEHYILKLNNIIAEKNGKLLFGEYINQNSKFKIKCTNGHEWETSAKIIFKNGWCPLCAKNNKKCKNILDIKMIAIARNGKLISKTYKNNKQLLTWECENKHLFKRSYYSVTRGRWCKDCDNKNRLNNIQNTANERGGKCLDDSYYGIEYKYNFQCNKKHLFKTIARNLLNGSWCPECSSSISEKICRTYFEYIFKKDFIKIRPDWLLNKSGNKLELDGFNEELQIAFEHNGTQHYEVNKFTKNNNELEIRQEFDRIKIERCKEMGIKLIVIPALMKRISIKNLMPFLIYNFEKQNIIYDKNLVNQNPNIKHCYVGD